MSYNGIPPFLYNLSWFEKTMVNNLNTLNKGIYVLFVMLQLDTIQISQNFQENLKLKNRADKIIFDYNFI